MLVFSPNLLNAHHLVRIRKGNEWKTAFKKPSGHFEYLVMPFGLSNAPAVFLALITDILRDMINHFVFVYLDDILIFSETMEKHVEQVRLVLQRLLDNKLFTSQKNASYVFPRSAFWDLSSPRDNSNPTWSSVFHFHFCQTVRRRGDEHFHFHSSPLFFSTEKL